MLLSAGHLRAVQAADSIRLESRPSGGRRGLLSIVRFLPSYRNKRHPAPVGDASARQRRENENWVRFAKTGAEPPTWQIRVRLGQSITTSDFLRKKPEHYSSRAAAPPNFRNQHRSRHCRSRQLLRSLTRCCRKRILRVCPSNFDSRRASTRKIDSRSRRPRFDCCVPQACRRLFRQHRPNSDITEPKVLEDAPWGIAFTSRDWVQEAVLLVRDAGREPSRSEGRASRLMSRPE